ncbi:MAG: tetraacyldisaccharide 4'-kinase [Alphaproteobacteria bacterium]|nr:tetraacyldisaccharide 4'-kinase [Alphaproteobacteria bacterium]NNF23643.1 tetraacyldisaccharide 4'-kinase [Paracoccaceae bacterium]
MKAPAFWYAPPSAPGLRARLLAPLGALYAWGTARRLASTTGYRAGVPVICIGNVNAGGTGKTPTAIAIAEWFAEKKIAAHVVTRGYGGRLMGPVAVDTEQHGAGDVGDEPLLLVAFAPVWVAKDRKAGVEAAEAAGAEIILLDDGLQNPAVQKDLSIVVVDAVMGFGNGRVIPAGPLREPLKQGLTRADFVLSIGNEAAQTLFSKSWGHAVDAPHTTAHLEILATGMPWAGLRVLAFAGIGYPEKFFATLRGLGAELVRAEALSDHQPLTPALMARLDQEAKTLGAQLVTTEKDAVRLPGTFRQKVLTLPVRLKFDDPGLIDAHLAPLMKR